MVNKIFASPGDAVADIRDDATAMIGGFGTRLAEGATLDELRRLAGIALERA